MLSIKYQVGLIGALAILAGGLLVVQTNVREAVLLSPIDDRDLGEQLAKGGVVPTDSDTLDLSGQNLTQIPTGTFDRTAIRTLNLSRNQLTGALPGEVRFLKKLQVLELSQNQFTGVPAEVGQLTELRVLNLANNNLTGLPHELGNLSKLERLDLRGNDYSVQDLAVIKARLPITTVIQVD